MRTDYRVRDYFIGDVDLQMGPCFTMPFSSYSRWNSCRANRATINYTVMGERRRVYQVLHVTGATAEQGILDWKNVHDVTWTLHGVAEDIRLVAL